MMMSCSAIHPGIPSLVKPFCPCFCWVLRNVISFFLDLSVFFGQGRLIHHQPSMVPHFDVLFFTFLTWAATVLCFFCWMYYMRDCPNGCLMYFHCFFPRFAFVLFLSICLNHPEPYWLFAPNRWLICNLFFFFKGRGCSLCAVKPYRLEIMVVILLPLLSLGVVV